MRHPALRSVSPHRAAWSLLQLNQPPEQLEFRRQLGSDGPSDLRTLGRRRELGLRKPHPALKLRQSISPSVECVSLAVMPQQPRFPGQLHQVRVRADFAPVDGMPLVPHPLADELCFVNAGLTEALPSVECFWDGRSARGGGFVEGGGKRQGGGKDTPVLDGLRAALYGCGEEGMRGVAEETDVLTGRDPGRERGAADEFPVDAGGSALNLIRKSAPFHKML